MGDNQQRMVGAGDSEELTDDLDFVLTAAAAGYFQVPRETPLTEVAEQEGISDIEATERIRRGVTELIARREEQE